MTKYYRSTSQHITEFLVNLAKKNGFEVCDLFDSSVPIFLLDYDNKKCSSFFSEYVVAKRCSRISFEEMVNLLETRASLKLNSEYTAVINKVDKTVTVGCQTFTFDKIQELASKLK